MRPRWLIVILTLLMAGIAIPLASVYSHVQTWQRFRETRAQQLATIKKLRDYPPPGWSPHAWQEALVTPNNVWGNVIHSPKSATPDEMIALQQQLDGIVAGASSSNSLQRVDQVFGVLLERGRSVDFVTGYRDEIREWARDHADSEPEG